MHPQQIIAGNTLASTKDFYARTHGCSVHHLHRRQLHSVAGARLNPRHASEGPLKEHRCPIDGEGRRRTHLPPHSQHAASSPPAPMRLPEMRCGSGGGNAESKPHLMRSTYSSPPPSLPDPLPINHQRANLMFLTLPARCLATGYLSDCRRPATPTISPRRPLNSPPPPSLPTTPPNFF